MANPGRTLIIHNIVSPYRLPVFEAVAKKVDITVWFCKDRPKERLWSNDRAGYTFKNRVLPSWRLGPFFLTPTIFWELLRTPFDTYVVGDFPDVMGTCFAVALIAKLRRKPLLLWNETFDDDVHYFHALESKTDRGSRLILSAMRAAMLTYRRLLFALPDHYLALSHWAEQYLIRRGVTPTRITRGIQIMPAAQLPKPTVPKSASIYADTRVILYLGYLVVRKDINTLIAAFRQIPGDDLRLVLAGSGPDGERLKALAAGDPRISFPGYAEGIDKANLYGWANIMVLPTLIDVWGLVINEGLYYHLPVITTTMAAGSELFRDEDDGRIVPPHDINAMRDALVSVLTSGRRPKDYPEVTDPVVGAAAILTAIEATAKNKS